MKIKKILIVTERRADYSRFKEILKEINLKKNLKYILVVTGIHLENDFGKLLMKLKKMDLKYLISLKCLTKNISKMTISAE